MSFFGKKIEGGRWKVFRPYQESKHYIFGVDASSGKEGANEAVCMGLCIEDGHQACILAGAVTPDEMLAEVIKVATSYGTAEVAVENELYGSTVIIGLKSQNYPSIYFHNEALDGMSGFSRVYGWNARKYRQTAIDWLRQDIGYCASTTLSERNQAVWIHDSGTKDQLKYFERNRSSGKYEARRGKLDDRVSALYIANFVRHERRPLYLIKAEEKVREPNYLDMLTSGSNKEEERSVDWDETDY